MFDFCASIIVVNQSLNYSDIRGTYGRVGLDRERLLPLGGLVSGVGVLLSGGDSVFDLVYDVGHGALKLVAIEG